MCNMQAELAGVYPQNCTPPPQLSHTAKAGVKGGAQGGKAEGRLPPAISRREMLLGGLGGIFTRYPPGGRAPRARIYEG